MIHNFFLTKQSIYCVVFDMCLLVGDDDDRLKCLENIKFWINSIVVHTYDSDTDETAKMFLVGTRRDVVSTPELHENISELLRSAFHNVKMSIAWKNVVENDSNGLCFYPVTNTARDNDEILTSLKQHIDIAIEEYGHVRVERPLSYLKTLDVFKVQLQEEGHTCVTFEEASCIAQANGVASNDVKSMLKLFHEAGRVMYHGTLIFYSYCFVAIVILALPATDTPGLDDVVILDPIKFFVIPVSNIVCYHHLQELPIHKMCQKKKLGQWNRMIESGVVEHGLLQLLLSDHNIHYSTIVKLMIKFGFLVQLETRGGAVEYLVPALLPLMTVRPDGYCWTSSEWSTCHFVFTTSPRLGDDESIIEKSDLDKYGYLPDGLFERLIGKAVNWAQTTRLKSSIEHIVLELCRNEAILQFGAKRFRLVLRSDLSTIEVNYEGKAVKAVHKQLSRLIKEILDDCMKSLSFFTALPYPYRTFHSDSSLFDPGNGDQLVSLPRLQSVVSNQTFLLDRQRNRLHSVEEVSENFKYWLVRSGQRDNFDIFLSYRQPQPAKWEHDSQFVHTGESKCSLMYVCVV